MMFEHFHHNASDIISHYKRKKTGFGEQMLGKILMTCIEAFECCKNNDTFYPEFCMENLFVNSHLEEKDYLGKGKAKKGLLKEFKFMHPFFIKSFFTQMGELLDLKTKDKKSVLTRNSSKFLIIFVHQKSINLRQ